MYSNLKLQMWRTGIRQNRLAQSVGIDETLLSRIINGFRQPDPEVRARIALFLGREEAWLFEQSTPEDSKDTPRTEDKRLCAE